MATPSKFLQLSIMCEPQQRTGDDAMTNYTTLVLKLAAAPLNASTALPIFILQVLGLSNSVLRTGFARQIIASAAQK
jgi:hypothetical protein